MADELTHGCRGVVDFVSPCLAVVSIYNSLPWASSNQARDCELIYPKCSLSHIRNQQSARHEAKAVEHPMHQCLPLKVAFLMSLSAIQ